jgi:hypothetical protein
VILKDPITIDVLKEALRAVFKGEAGHDEDWIKTMSEFIMDFFGYEDMVLDNTLTPRDRDIFYILETAGLIRTEMEETTIHKGKTWRIHYWTLNRERIKDLTTRSEPVKEVQQEGEGSIYKDLSEKVWTRK